ncbi:DNA-directed DNA polymerase epsilon, subunit C [Yamadazyma tenuis]|uniref:Histone-fold-containing protein n=1 Tax=Candida tenuis (strain ATCC 10573 / BCRC 21748 / CBS 615 / JCM 9827 / NBRC 10315 / NRRL Y-1498 / VKM Y-70) TaxID=590646 RepID=G3B1Y3_CANTC|nr:histone-fold-containing protein [Yamadazyma tenuis ATCC 10573]EGV64561.1 histone-fold-containing protein [Yamadazyma tenuis ATCC 10573]WEJ97325.1 DNA-directed DNA polymerase epsilon, subunit C [Yamadazyma tenuis]
MADLTNLMNPTSDDDASYTYNPSADEEQPHEDLLQEAPTFEEDDIIKNFEKIKTHFPAARIKKIMQSDEDIGKVAQATPVVVGRALEIFMANLLVISIKEAKKTGSKRISASHIRAAVENTEQFDFLIDAVDKYPPLKH